MMVAVVALASSAHEANDQMNKTECAPRSPSRGLWRGVSFTVVMMS